MLLYFFFGIGLALLLVMAETSAPYIKLTKIRLSVFHARSNQSSTTTRPSATMVRLLWITDSYNGGNKLYNYYQSVGAVNVALKRLAAEHVLNVPLVDLEVAHVAVDERSCSAAGDMSVVSRVYFELQYKFDAIIGPQCSEGALAVSAFAESLRKPHILLVASHPDFSNKLRYPYVMQNAIATDLVAECMVEMFRQLGKWKRVAFLFDRDDYISILMEMTLRTLVEKGTKNFTIAFTASLSGISSTDNHIQSVLLEAGQAFVLGMHTGEYQWIAQRPMLLNNLWPPYAPIKVHPADVVNESYSLQPTIDSLKLPVNEIQLYETFRSFMEFDQVYGDVSGEVIFNEEAMAAAFEPPWSVNRTEYDELVRAGVIDGRISRFAGYLADGIYLYGRGIREALDQHVDYTNSAVMHEVFLNISFQGKSGPFSINSDGKRLSDLALYAPIKDFYQQHPLKRFTIQATMRCASLSAAERAAGLAGRLDFTTPLEWYGATNNQPPPDIPVCGWKHEHCQVLSTTSIALVACAGAFFVTTGIAAAYVYVRRRRRLAALLNADWNLHFTDFAWPKTDKFSTFLRHSYHSNNSSVEVTDAHDDEFGGVKISRTTLNTNSAAVSHNPAATVYKGNLSVFVRPINVYASATSGTAVHGSHHVALDVATFRLDSLRELRSMKDADHDNINRFIGIVALKADDGADKSDSPSMLAVTALCMKGTLAEVLYDNGDYAAAPLDNLFKFCFINDTASGLNYLHNVSELKWHGRLSSSTVVFDGRWTAKLTDFGFWSFGPACTTNKWLAETGASTTLSKKLLWVAPEVLRDPNIAWQNLVLKLPNMDRSRQAADMYSLGVVVGEIMHQLRPYRNHTGEFAEGLVSIAHIVRLLIASNSDENGLSPGPYSGSPLLLLQQQRDECTNITQLHENITPCFQEVIRIVTDCCDESASARPTIRQVVRRLANLNNKIGSKSVMDNVINRLEMYSVNLEQIVQERTNELMTEKQRADGLLALMLPECVAAQLKSGKPVVPEHFEESTVFFSDIVSFTIISGASTPMQVVQLLNDLYTFMDSTLDRFAPYVYKVETIGDAYMIVSGIPLRTSLHARIVASVALAFLADIEEAVHVPKLEKADPSLPAHVRLRVGLNSGPCVAGVVGLQMPRYCLFGDTVNVASRMESNGEAMRIHVSQSTWQALQLWPEFTFEDRGVLHIKGKGEMHTYWLLDGPQAITLGLTLRG